MNLDVNVHTVARRNGEASLVRAIGVRALAANIVNQIIGSGIFLLPAAVAAILGPSAIIAYVVCAAAMGLMALCFAELGSRVARTGGLYAYIETAFGPYFGFLAGTLFTLCEIVSNAAIGIVLIESMVALLPVLSGTAPRAGLLVLLFGALAAANIRGVRTGARLVEVVTAAKLAPLALVVAAGLFAGKAGNLAWSHMPSLGDIGRASLLLLFAFSGTESALSAGGEVRNPSSTVPRAILLGLASVTVLYGGVQLAAQGILGPELATAQEAPLAVAAGRAFGHGGGGIVLGAAMLSAFGYLTGAMLASPRLLFALARDGFLPATLGAVHSRFHTPHIAIIAFAALACGFAITGSFRALAVLSVVAQLLVNLGCCLATLELRRRDVRADGTPFRVSGGPLVPILACLVVFWLLLHAALREYIAVAGFLGVASFLYFIRRLR